MGEQLLVGQHLIRYGLWGKVSAKSTCSHATVHAEFKKLGRDYLVPTPEHSWSLPTGVACNKRRGSGMHAYMHTHACIATHVPLGIMTLKARQQSMDSNVRTSSLAVQVQRHANHGCCQAQAQ